MRKYKIPFTVFLLLSILIIAVSCGAEGQGQVAAPGGFAEQSIIVRGDGIESELTFTLAELASLPDANFEHIYSTINNWPTARFYAARGIRIDAILLASGVLDTVQSVTFRSHDSYEVTITRKQLLEEQQYYYPLVSEGSGEGAETVYPLIAYEFKEGAADMPAAQPDDFCLIIGQRNHLEHTNPAFVENLKEIVVSGEPPEQWDMAGIFPASGIIPSGETIKLQHPDFGLVKIFYTLDGSLPTEMSAMYNPSTYQPELNKPIVFTGDATLKALVSGFGKENSDIAEFEIKVQ